MNPPPITYLYQCLVVEHSYQCMFVFFNTTCIHNEDCIFIDTNSAWILDAFVSNTIWIYTPCKKPSSLRKVVPLAVWFRIVLTQMITWVYKDSLTMTYLPNINVGPVLQLWYQQVDTLTSLLIPRIHLFTRPTLILPWWSIPSSPTHPATRDTWSLHIFSMRELKLCVVFICVCTYHLSHSDAQIRVWWPDLEDCNVEWVVWLVWVWIKLFAIWWSPVVFKHTYTQYL